MIQNGIISEYFYPERGCRQGDPISPYLFLLCAEILGILIRNEKDIKGIIIDGEEYKISQYADDTSIIMDGTPQSYDGILRVLDFFAQVSGLKINFTKTKMVWIGSKKFSKDVFHHSRWKLSWNNLNFELLGIKFSVKLDEMEELNYLPKLSEIRRLINQWKLRKLTPIGRITIIKTLIIPKLNHLILALPNPKTEYLKTFEHDIFHFLWGCKVHKVKKSTIIQDYNHGGLKMVDYGNFITALKATWMRRLIKTDTKWVKLLESILKISISEIWRNGPNYSYLLCKKLENSFWKEVLLSWLKIIEQTPLSRPQIINDNIWHNPQITIDNKSIFIKSYVNKGFIFVSDLLNIDGTFRKFDELKHINPKTNFIEYASLRTAVTTRLHTQDIHLPNLQNTLQYGPIVPNHILLFINTCKGCKPMYNILLDKKREICTSISKWREKGYNYSQTSWSRIFELPFKCTQESKLHWLQYQILHRIVPTNKYLFNIKKSRICCLHLL